MKQALNTLEKLETLAKFFLNRNYYAAIVTLELFIRKIKSMIAYVSMLSDATETEGLHVYSFSGSKKMDTGLAAISLANNWLIPNLEGLSIGQRDDITLSVAFWSAMDQLVSGGYVDCSDTSTSTGQRQINIAEMQLVFELLASVALLRKREVALISVKMDYEALYEQKQYLLSQCRQSSSAEGLVNLLDNIQDSIVLTSMLTEKEVFPHLGEE